jgi:hypothetical protein
LAEKSASEAPARHWLVDASLGAGAALVALTVAHAALPDRVQITPRPAASAARLAAPAATASEPVALIAFKDPVPGREIISPFGLRQLPWEENGRLHEGVDIAAPLGAPVLAAADGVVARAGVDGGYGRFVEVKHAAGLSTLYAHMGALADGLSPGVALKAGSVLGRIGSSGTSTGPHLHFELRDAADRPLNPGVFLGRAFATAADLPLKTARRFPHVVRVAYVSAIPQSKRALMAAREANALAASDAARDASSVTVFYGDGRAHARFRVRSYAEPSSPTAPQPGPAA